MSWHYVLDAWFSFRALDSGVEALGVKRMSLGVDELLRSSEWQRGEDARPRHDDRLRRTPWRRWILGDDVLSNDALYLELTSSQGSRTLSEILRELHRLLGRRCVFCVDTLDDL